MHVAVDADKGSCQTPAPFLLKILPWVFASVGVVTIALGIWMCKADYELRNEDWICVTGRVEYAAVDYTVGTRGSFSQVSCDYSYEYSGSIYQRNRIGIGGVSDSEYRDLWKRIRGKKSIPVWVNECDPGLSVLLNPKERTYWWAAIILAIGLLMVGGSVLVSCITAMEAHYYRKHPCRVVNIIVD